jgi:hypothetical protein
MALEHFSLMVSVMMLEAVVWSVAIGVVVACGQAVQV